MTKKLIFLLLIAFPSIFYCQTFRAGVILGVNASQVDGDDYAGFDKLGPNLGLGVNFDISDRWEAGMELLWSQRGSRADVFTGTDQKIVLNYIEIPLCIAYKDWLIDDYYKVRFEAGLSYGRLINQKVTIVGFTTELDDINENNFSYILGAKFFSSPKTAFGFRFTSSINNLLDKPSVSFPGAIIRLRGYFLSFRIHKYL